ncbi:MAG: diacylglycerol kinase [Betaproteobacteria bacterium]|nr:diacylglycerol kinase [Betaproteobacteria bacterium]NCP81415.1 diacylglycerol kinase [Rhodoferax sp.]NCS61869.1 diacylglycerol kinase [Rhodoferax sp.]PIZ23665.1 MAG: diacylglycerol kinase [Comamonadaceae bacterium CG_4_10_14_0_8_um_filter_57_29]PJC15343.1 MAG: diacylglycerol kinase [Comamonadaceae bacterium CG_4_9_14_0_8_um_filter_57_21]
MQDSEISPFKGKTGLSRLFAAAGNSMNGFKVAWLGEAGFRQVCLLAVLGIGIMWWLSLPGLTGAVIVFAHLLSIAAELINSAVEAAVDHTSLAWSELAKRAKDLASAAQLVTLINIAAVWLFVLLG